MNILHQLQQKDIDFFFRIQHYKYSLRKLSRSISRSADGFLYVLIPLLYWSVSDVEGLAFCKEVVMAFAIERALYFTLKHTCRRSRPPKAIPGYCSHIQASDEFSFPSGHTCGAFLFVTLCAQMLSPWCAIFYVWATMVGLSRIVLGVHFPTDVLVGALIGVVTGLAVTF